MTRLKAHWKALALLLTLILWAAWYSRPVGIHTLGIGNPEAIDVRISYLEPGVGITESRDAGLTPGDPLWQTVLDEAEALRFRRPPWNLVRQYRTETVIHTEAAPREELILYFWDSGGNLTLQLGGERSWYSSRHNGRNLPASLSGGADAAQALMDKLWPLLEEPA